MMDKTHKKRNETPKAAKASKLQTLTLSRIVNASRDKVFKAWTEPSQIMRWWRPKGFTCPSCKVDLRVGGTFLYCMRSPEGKDFWGRGIYQEIVPGQKLVYVDSFADETGNQISPSTHGLSAEWPAESRITVTFADENNKTKVTLQHADLPNSAESEMCKTGWNEMLDQLVENFSKSAR